MKGKSTRLDQWREAFGRSSRRVILTLIVGIVMIALGALYALLGDTVTLAVILMVVGLLMTFVAVFTIGV